MDKIYLSSMKGNQQVPFTLQMTILRTTDTSALILWHIVSSVTIVKNSITYPFLDGRFNCYVYRMHLFGASLTFDPHFFCLIEKYNSFGGVFNENHSDMH